MRPRSSRRVRLVLPLAAAVALALLLLPLSPAVSGHRAPNASASSRLVRAVPGSVPVTPVQWCGGDLAGADRKPDLLGGNQVHVIYAVPSDGQEQFGAYVHRIVTDLSAIDTWWRGQDPTRTPRFDRAPFPGCTTSFGQIDVSFVRLPHPASFFAPLDSRVGSLAGDLGQTFNEPGKKYLVYYDGPLNPPVDVCGTAFRGPSSRGGAGSVAAVWLRGCVLDVGAGDIQAAVAAHELLHQLGVLPAGAPHPCPRDSGHPCDTQLDLMYPALSESFDKLVLDAGRDDYYGHSGTWFDAQDSLWLARGDAQPAPLTVTVQARAQQDRVTSEPVGIECPATCSVLLDTGSQVQLTADPASGSRLVAWGGACAGRTTCTVTMDAAKTVTAQFGPSAFRLSLAVTGSGRALAGTAGLSCTRRCSGAVDAGAVVRVRAAAARGWRFLRWSGACRGRGACSVRMSDNRAVGVVFQRLRPRG